MGLILLFDEFLLLTLLALEDVLHLGLLLLEELHDLLLVVDVSHSARAWFEGLRIAHNFVAVALITVTTITNHERFKNFVLEGREQLCQFKNHQTGKRNDLDLCSTD